MKQTGLITGGSGLLALNWALAIRDRHAVTFGIHEWDVSLVGIETRQIDLESFDHLVRAFEKNQGEIVIHTAGFTNVEECEAKPDLAQHINVELSANVAQACAELGLQLVHTRIGVDGRMDTLQCAIVLAKLEHFDGEAEQRIAIGQRYNQLMDEAGIARVQQHLDRTSVFAQYTIFTENREQIQMILKEAGIPTAVHYPITLNKQPAYRHLGCLDCTPVARDIAKKVMSLYLKAYDGVSAARTDIADYLSWYNTHHPHSSLKRLTLHEKYLAALPQMKLVA